MLKNIWYAVLASAELRPDVPKMVVLGTKAYVIFRDSQGVYALDNECPHQGAALARGTVKQGCIRCPYHAWQFDGQGQCQNRPSDPDAKIRQRDHTHSWAAREQDGFIWLFAGDAAASSTVEIPSLITPDGAEKWSSVYGVFDFDAHLDRVMLNGTDIAHVPFVHPDQFGNALRPETPRYQLQYHPGGASASIASTAPSTLEQIVLSRLALNGDMQAIATAYFYMPNVTVLQVARGGKTVLLVSAHVPIGDEAGQFKTQTHWAFHRNFLHTGFFDIAFRKSMTEVFQADADIINHQRPQVLTEELLKAPSTAVPSDLLGVYYRKLLLTAIQAQLD
jgi:phenylpropionate dioxygenase-like ring-hydroxylating dioxygenase large terminal subunit